MNTAQMIEALQIPADYERPSIEPPDGNAFSIFAAVGRAVRGQDRELGQRYAQLCQQADSYETVLAVATNLVNFDFSGDDEDEDE